MYRQLEMARDGEVGAGWSEALGSLELGERDQQAGWRMPAQAGLSPSPGPPLRPLLSESLQC